ncbi:D-fructose-1,6-bisphosphatase protein [Hyphomicrobium sp. GJ21]|jgi:fructose-1,6-bisphosphatase I|uniref:class 1 fructose-bisphosphatase n=1 Tax=Hyphomicrobium sp. GJ21 TaxID=113574 RepID=UPI000622BE02|nr:class 1 fructose-bisphosphatase [Hyphomicrobium sp. GJ21]CEJ87313.1 D-fructose-1,6-bisphosphatase protein [Hyphomicrobium sp. GJ21]
MGLATLKDYLSDWTLDGRTRSHVADTVLALAETSIRISELVARGSLGGRLGQIVSKAGEFDEQKEIDLLTNGMIAEALKAAPVAALASEESEHPITLNPDAPLLVATDPLDGSSNVDANVSFGTIFSILPRHPASVGEAAFLRPGSHQLAAGFVVYGPHTALVLTVGLGTQIFTLDRSTNTFHMTSRNVSMPAETTEYAINSSNARHWDDPIRIYIHDCENGANGPCGHDFNMRWTGSPVADILRILTRGGIYLYPGDRRKGFHQGRIRLIYEANPFSWLIEQAGGKATTGRDRVLDVVPSSLHQRTPLICGSRYEVDRVVRIYSGQEFKGDRSPLFGRRGLFRALP